LAGRRTQRLGEKSPNIEDVQGSRRQVCPRKCRRFYDAENSYQAFHGSFPLQRSVGRKVSGSKQRRRITKTTSTGDSWKKRRRRERLLAEIGFTEHTPHTHTLTPTDGDSARRLMACRIRAITSGARRETGLEESSLKASSVCHLRSDRFQTDVRISSSIPTATYYAIVCSSSVKLARTPTSESSAIATPAVRSVSASFCGFTDEGEVQNVVNSFNGMDFSGRSLRVNFASKN
uniref:Coat protein n=1 Tax=Heligmosomoides polygyrus TaxID=6339 RepID=A0A8L8JW52_HELPZ